jgi:hypothetical protein
MSEATLVAEKPARRRRNKKAEECAKVKRTLHLSVEASKRLDLHAIQEDVFASDLVERLINAHLTQWYARRGSKSGQSSPDDAADDRQEIVADLSETNESAKANRAA